MRLSSYGEVIILQQITGRSYNVFFQEVRNVRLVLCPYSIHKKKYVKGMSRPIMQGQRPRQEVIMPKVTEKNTLVGTESKSPGSRAH